MENLGNINGQQRWFPETDEEKQWLIMNYQRAINLSSGYRMPENGRGSAFGWPADQQAMMPSAPNFGIMNCCNHNHSCNANGMYMQPLPESTMVPFVPPMPIESVPPVVTSSRKKAPKRWSREEHKLFLIGLKKFKRGDWKSIARNLVVTRSTTQVASHAQKYFNRPAAVGAKAAASDESTRKKRTSIHDTRVEDVSSDPDEIIKSLQDIISDQHGNNIP